MARVESMQRNYLNEQDETKEGRYRALCDGGLGDQDACLEVQYVLFLGLRRAPPRGAPVTQCLLLPRACPGRYTATQIWS